MRSLLFAAALAAISAQTTSSAKAGLYGLAIMQLNDDGPEASSIAHITTAGQVTYHGNFTFAATPAGMDCTLAWSGGANPTYFGAMGIPVQVIQVDANTGTQLQLHTLQPQYGVGSLAYDNATDTLYGVAEEANGQGYDFISIDYRTGAVTTLHKGVPLPYLSQCLGELSAASKRYYAVTDTTVRDDSDQDLVTLDLTTGAVVSSLPWASSSGNKGRLSVFTVRPPTTPGGNESLLVLDADEAQQRPVQLLDLDPLTGASTLLATLPKSRTQVEPQLGSLALTSDGSMAYALAFDDNTQDNLLLSFALTAKPVTVTVTVINEHAASGMIWGLRTAL